MAPLFNAVISLVSLYECKWSMSVLMTVWPLTQMTKGEMRFLSVSTHFALSLYSICFLFKCWAARFYLDKATKKSCHILSCTHVNSVLLSQAKTLFRQLKKKITRCFKELKGQFAQKCMHVCKCISFSRPFFGKFCTFIMLLVIVWVPFPICFHWMVMHTWGFLLNIPFCVQWKK